MRGERFPGEEHFERLYAMYAIEGRARDFGTAWALAHATWLECCGRCEHSIAMHDYKATPMPCMCGCEDFVKRAPHPNSNMAAERRREALVAAYGPGALCAGMGV